MPPVLQIGPIGVCVRRRFGLHAAQLRLPPAPPQVLPLRHSRIAWVPEVPPLAGPGACPRLDPRNDGPVGSRVQPARAGGVAPRTLGRRSPPGHPLVSGRPPAPSPPPPKATPPKATLPRSPAPQTTAPKTTDPRCKSVLLASASGGASACTPHSCYPLPRPKCCACARPTKSRVAWVRAEPRRHTIPTCTTGSAPEISRLSIRSPSSDHGR